MKNKSDSIKGIIFLAWFVLTIISISAFKGNNYFELLTFGQAFLVFGLIAIFSIDNISREDYFLLIFILFGLCLIQIAIVGIVDNTYINKMIVYSIANSVILLGVLLLILENQYKGKNKKRRRLSNFKTIKKGIIKLYKRSYKYNIRNLSLIKSNKKINTHLTKKTKYIK